MVEREHVTGRPGEGRGTPPPAERTGRPAAIAFLLTAALLAVVQAKARVHGNPMLLAERFLRGGGWLEVPLLAAWAAFLVTRMLPRRGAAPWRLRLWSIFSAAFFAQLLLGLAGAGRLLMTGRLHLPVPALIVGGPLYRGEGLFMPVLFGVTVLLVGPAWCSHLCYIGAWDNGCSRLGRRTPRPELALGGGAWRRRLRWATLGLVAGGAIALRRAGAPAAATAMAGAAFGLVGVALMLVWSRRTGVMAHCSWYCPIGILSTRLGKVNPWRIRLTERCTRCCACSLACRYDALTADDIARGRPNASCTLCGDCHGACRHGALEFRFPGLSPERARAAFIVAVATLHAVFLGVARI